jgi:hypothetical protein
MNEVISSSYIDRIGLASRGVLNPSFTCAAMLLDRIRLLGVWAMLAVISCRSLGRWAADPAVFGSQHTVDKLR